MATAWSFVDNQDTCVLYHRATGAVIELNSFPGAFFNFIEKRGNKGMLCEENASIQRNRPVKESTEKAIAKLAGGRPTTAGNVGVLGPDFKFSGWEATPAADQLALHRPKKGTRMALADIIGFVDRELLGLDEIQVCPLLVLHPEGFCFIGISGQCIAVQEQRMIDHQDRNSGADSARVHQYHVVRNCSAPAPARAPVSEAVDSLDTQTARNRFR
jgi:hypothetical protein